MNPRCNAALLLAGLLCTTTAHAQESTPAEQPSAQPAPQTVEIQLPQGMELVPDAGMDTGGSVMSLQVHGTTPVRIRIRDAQSQQDVELTPGTALPVKVKPPAVQPAASIPIAPAQPPAARKKLPHWVGMVVGAPWAVGATLVMGLALMSASVALTVTPAEFRDLDLLPTTPNPTAFKVMAVASLGMAAVSAVVAIAALGVPWILERAEVVEP